MRQVFPRFLGIWILFGYFRYINCHGRMENYCWLNGEGSVMHAAEAGDNLLKVLASLSVISWARHEEEQH